jgi:hypothetical protein
MKTVIQHELPEQLVAEARVFVEQGWVGDFDGTAGGGAALLSRITFLPSGGVIYPRRRKLRVRVRE